MGEDWCGRHGEAWLGGKTGRLSGRPFSFFVRGTAMAASIEGDAGFCTRISFAPVTL
jgi:hypothetical protein